MTQKTSEGASTSTPGALSADDPRHGTYAGYAAHRKEQTMCDSCRLAALRRDKAYRLHRIKRGPKNVPLGDEAASLLNTWNLAALSKATGMTHQHLFRLKTNGAQQPVRRETLARILAAGQPVTPVGIARRLQALAAMGWSNRVIQRETGIDSTNLDKLRRGERQVFVRQTTAERVCAAYEALSMRLPEPSRAVSHTRNLARRRGYLPPLAWDDIDDPKDKGHGLNAVRNESRKDYIDLVTVERILAGEGNLPASLAEKREVVRRWTRSHAELARLTGWKVERYVDREDGAA